MSSGRALLFGVAAVLIGALLAGGATRPPATLVVAAASGLLVGLAAAAAARRDRPLRLPPLALPPLALTLLALAQLVPLPPSLRARLTPEAERIARLVLAGLEAPGAWRPLTVDVAATLNDAARLAGLVALAVALDAVDRQRRRRLRRVLAGALAALVAVPALHLAGVPLPQWMTSAAQSHDRQIFSLVNPNHAAAAIGALLPTVLALAARQHGGARWGLAGLALAGNLALFASVSRAGVSLGVVGEAVTLWALTRRQDVRGRQRLVAVGVLGVIVAIAIIGEPVAERLRPIDPMEGFGRLRLWRAALPLIRDHAWTGVGQGAFCNVMARYAEGARQIRFGFVENEYLQTFADVGVGGALLLLAALAAAAWRARAAFNRGSLGAQAALVGVAVLALHNFVDFSWAGAGAAGIALALGAIAFPYAGPSLPRVAVAAVAAAPLALAAVATTSLGRTADADAAALTPASPTARFEEAFRRHPSDGYIAALAAARLLDGDDPALGRWIDRALLLGPYDPWAHSLAARALAGAGYRDQAAVEMRAALANASRDLGPFTIVATQLFSDDEADRIAAAVPDDTEARRLVLDALRGARRWQAIERLASKWLELQPDDAAILRPLVEAERERGDRAQLVAHARKLAAVDGSEDASLIAAAALADGGDAAAADQLLEQAALRHPRSVALPVARARLLVERADFSRARTLLEEPLARAVTGSDKAALHAALADVEERSGHPNRAALERAAAARAAR